MFFLGLIQFIVGIVFSNAAYANYQFNLTPGVSPTSHDIYHLHMTIFWICVVIGVIVFSVIFYSILNHRKSKGVKAAQFYEHIWLELTWTIIPFFILIAMAIPATRVLIHMNNVDQPDITIKVTGSQWKWNYDYLDQGINFFSNNATPYEQMKGLAPKDDHYLRVVDKPLVVPIHKKIRFLMTSTDVIHSWWVTDLGIKRDAVPGFINEAWTRINRAGTYHGQCAELCGINHAFMPIVVIALPEKDFENWVTQQKTPTVPIPTPSTATTPGTPVTAPAPNGPKSLEQLMQQGEKIFLTTCAVCHQASGEGMPPTFPALKGSKIATGPRAAHLDRVLNGKPGTAMQAFKNQLSDDDLAAVITYERNAWGNNTKDIIQSDDIKKAKQEPPAS